MPDGHHLVQANVPRREEDLRHVLVPGSDHIPSLPKPIPKRQQVRRREPQRLRDREEPPP